jgi:hypothetical protein
MSNVKAGTSFLVKYPFHRGTHEEHDGEGVAVVPTWIPGVRFEAAGLYGEDSEAFADGEGQMVLTVVDVFKPGRFPARVFFTRRWVDPDGNTFGKGCLRITTQAAFVRRTKGYMHEYVVSKAAMEDA